MTLAAEEFIRRFLLHVLPSGFVRIRHYGFLANRDRGESLDLCRRLINPQAASQLAPGELPNPPMPAGDQASDEPRSACPACKTGRMVIIEVFRRLHTRCGSGSAPTPWA